MKNSKNICIYKFFRVFSHGQITFGDHEVPPSEENTMPPKSGGHKRTASKTDFILPPDHAEKERKRNSLQRQNSEGGAGTILTSAGSFKKRQDSGSGHRRNNSLAFFRGHSRQASRTDSIYTIRSNKGHSKKRNKVWKFLKKCCGKSDTDGR